MYIACASKSLVSMRRTCTPPPMHEREERLRPPSYVCVCVYIYIYIYISCINHISYYTVSNPPVSFRQGRLRDGPATPGLHNKIPALKIFARGWVAQKYICS